MHSIKLSILLFLLLSMSSGLISQQDDKDDFVFGKITKDSLFTKLSFWEKIYQKYQPDSLLISKIKSTEKNFDVIIIMGTWCGDSRRNVPAFLKIAYLSGIKNIKIYGTDRSKNTVDNLSQKYNIKKVPTFIFIKNNNEIGRIVENPKITIESDILEILNE